MNDHDKELLLEAAVRMADVIRQLDRLAERLEADVRPGHVDYISKADAAAWVVRLAADLRG